MSTPELPPLAPLPPDGDQLATAIARQLPHYEIEDLVGKGGTAHIFRARDRRDGRLVAIKLVSPDVARVLGVERFLREIQVAGSVKDEHLVPLAESGEVHGLPYYVMPLATGGSLRDKLVRERQLQLTEALRIARDVAIGLGHLHRAGIIHRDVKPENVLFGTVDEPVRLADYGLARALTAAALLPLTSTGIVIGTPAYMSPEQGAGDLVDARADIYSWGCLFYEMLAGEPPFWGATAQTLIGRHVNDPPPTLQSTRANLPGGVEAMVLRALAKSPADRYQTTDELITALEALDLKAPPTPSMQVRRASRRGLGIAIAVAALAAAVAVWFGRPNLAPLDSNRVVIFPFSSTTPDNAGEGEQLALLIGGALERSEPLKWLDGWSMLDTVIRRDPRQLSQEQAGRLTRRAGARYFLEGSLLRSTDSLRVTARLHDLEERGGVTSHTAVAPAEAGLARVGFDAIIGILARLEGIRSPDDLALLRDRKPAAVAAWLQGERLYRASQTDDALRRYEEAVAEDSLLAPAALRGAIAASWIGSGRAGALAALALRHPQNLSPRQRALAPAVAAFADGRATPAIVALRETLGIDSLWVDPWMLAGEVYLHLLPSEGLDSLALRVLPPPVSWPLESMAEAAFTRASSLDSLFVPPRVNLAQIALRQARLDEADRLLDPLRQQVRGSVNLSRLELGLRCQRSAGRLDWRAETARDRASVFQMAALFLVSPDSVARTCAASGFRAVLASDTAFAAEGWMSLVGLHGMLVADNRPAEAIALVDTAIAKGLSPALGVFVLDGVAGMDAAERGAAFIRQLGTDFSARGTPSLWLLTTWHANQGHGDTVQQLAGVLRSRAAASGDRLDRLVADIAAAYALLARGDSAGALRSFRALEPTGPRQEVQYSLWESLAVERLVLARLSLASGQPALAHRVATTFDHPGVFLHALFMRASLGVREQAARALGDAALAESARRRLAIGRIAGEGTP